MSGDIVDKSQDAEDAFLRAALTAKRQEGPPPTGFCYYCGEALTNRHHRFCDADCRDDYEREQEHNAQR